MVNDECSFEMSLETSLSFSTTLILATQAQVPNI